MSTPLRYAAGIAREGAAVPAASDEPPVSERSDDATLNLRDVSWARATPAQARAAKTPTKLRKAIDDAAVEAASTQRPGSTAAPSPSAVSQQRADGADGVRLRTAVVDAVSQFEALLDDAKFRVQRNRDRCVEAGTGIMEALKAFDDQFKYTDRVGFGVKRLVAEADVATDLDFQARYGPSISVPDKQRYLSVLELLKESPVVGHEADALKRRIETNVTRPLLPLDDAAIPSLLLSINGFTTTDALAATRQKLDVFHAKLRRLREELDALTAKASAARCAEDLALADALEADVIVKMREIFEVHVECLKFVGASDSAQTTGMAGQLEAIMSTDAIARVSAQNAQIRDTARRDGATLDADRTARHKRHQQSIANYNAAVVRSTERLERNAFQQSLVWDEVGKGLERIDELRRDAAAMVEDHLQMTETERKRLKEYKEFQESYATHREYVRLVGENTEAALDFIAELETHMEAARETIRNMRVEERVAELSQEERKRLDEHYTVYSGRTARRAHALSVRTTNSQRQHSEAVFQHRQAGACDDPEGKTHAERGEALDKSVMVLRQRLAEVEAIFDEGQERYTALMAAEDGFDPEHNAAVTAAKLRTSLREQFSTSLDGLSKQQATVTSELHGKAVDHDQKANAARLMAEKKREKRLLASGSAAQSPSKAPSADEAVAE